MNVHASKLKDCTPWIPTTTGETPMKKAESFYAMEEDDAPILSPPANRKHNCTGQAVWLVSKSNHRLNNYCQICNENNRRI